MELDQTDISGSSSKIKNGIDQEHPNKLGGDEGMSV